MSKKFDFEEALKAVQSGQAITGKDGVLAPLVKQLTEAALEGELDSHLAEDVSGNRRNGKSKKTVKSTSGAFELETPRDRAGTFEPEAGEKAPAHRFRRDRGQDPVDVRRGLELLRHCEPGAGNVWHQRFHGDDLNDHGQAHR